MYKQSTNETCGVASAMMILSSLGYDIELNEKTEFVLYYQMKMPGSRYVVASDIARLMIKHGLEAKITQHVSSKVKQEQETAYKIYKNASKFAPNHRSVIIFKYIIEDCCCIAGIKKEERDYSNDLLNAQDLFNEITSKIDSGSYVALTVANFDENKELRGHHWMVAYGHEDDKILIACPTNGKVEYTAEELYANMTSPIYGQQYITVTVKDSEAK